MTLQHAHTCMHTLCFILGSTEMGNTTHTNTGVENFHSTSTWSRVWHHTIVAQLLPQATKPGQGLDSQVRVPGVQLEKQKSIFCILFFWLGNVLVRSSCSRGFAYAPPSA